MIPPTLRRRFLFAFILLLTAPASCAIYFEGNTVTSVPAPASLVVRNVKLYDPVDGPAGSAIAVRDGKIVAVGSDATIKEYIQSWTKVVDAGGGLLIPGLADAHAHLLNLGFELERADLRGARSELEMIARAVEFSKKHRDGWLLGRSWDQNLWENKQFPTRAALDAAMGDRPAFLVRVDGHAGLANGAAMKIANITKATADPDGGKIMKDSAGEPTGLFVDTAMSLITGAIPGATDADRERSYLNAQKEVLASGIVSIHDAGLSAADQRVLADLDRRHLLKLRIYGMAAAPAIPAKAVAGDRYELRAVKGYADGALGSRGAAMLEPYSDDAKNHGLLVMSEAELRDVAGICAERDLQLCIHAIGDRGNRIVLDTYETIFTKKFGKPSRPQARWRVEHCQVVAPSDFARFQQLGLIASMQPTHATSDGPWAPDRIGSERMEGAYAWRRFLDLNIPIAFGSDFPVESHDPRFGIFASVTRRPPENMNHAPFGPSPPLSIKDTIAAFTTGPAYASFHENEWGRLKIGFAGDFTIFDRDFINNADPSEILKSRVLWTIIHGEVAFP